MIIVYTGRGKGKTCACVGQALRALGHGHSVVFAQFFKHDGAAGEQKLLSSLLGSNFRAGGPGFFRDEKMRPLHRQHSLDLLDWALRADARMIVLDEILYALAASLVMEKELEEALRRVERKDPILVLSGRNAPDWLVERADIVTEMREVKHWLAAGVPARPGVEF